MPAMQVCRASLAACLAVGIGFMLVAVLLVPALPHFQLDAVLTPQQLADIPTRDTTLALLQKANGNAWLLWFVAGLAVASCAGTGLAACCVRSAKLELESPRGHA